MLEQGEASGATDVFPLGSQGNGGGFTVAEGANDTAHQNFTHNGMRILHEGLRYNDEYRVMKNTRCNIKY